MTADATIRPSEGVLGRTLRLGLIPMAVLIAAMVAAGTVTRYLALKHAAENDLRRLAAVAALELDREGDDAVELAKALAQMQAGGLFGMRRLTLDVLRHAVVETPSILGAYVCYEPDADGKDDESLKAGLPEGSIDGQGRFLPYWFRDPAKGGGLGLKINKDMETSLYYDGVRRAFRATGRPEPLVGEPYLYDGDFLVEQTYPIVIDGRFLGIAGIDRSVQDLRSNLLRLAEASEAEVYLVSGRGSFVATSRDGDEVGTEGSLPMQKVAETAFGEVLLPMLDPTNEPRLAVGADPTTGVSSYWAWSTIPTGAWTVVLSRPVSEVTGPLIQQTAWLAGGAAAAIAAILFLVVTILRGFSARIRSAVGAAARVAEGDLSAEVPSCPRHDEAGVLLRTLAAMRAGLIRLVGQVKHAAISLHAATTEISAAGRQQEDSADEFESSSSEIAAAVHQINRTADGLVSTMSEVRAMTDDAASLAAGGRTSLDGMRTSMRSLEEATASIAAKLAAINEKAGGITAIVTTITKVADQTNLLSVNAAIEAEKAGEYGRGFLVVAREIRRLADQAARATLDIEKMVAQMQSAVSAGVMEMDRFAEQVRGGVGEVDSIGGQMGSIIEHVSATAERFVALDEGVRQQSSGARQIDEAMGRLRDRARNSSESVREFASAAENLQKALGSLRAVIDAFRMPG